MVKQYVDTKAFKEAMNIPYGEEINIKLLNQGEYNINYIFIHPITRKKLILRLNTKSQMNLKNQIEYEYKALEGLYTSGRTPKAYYVDNSMKDIDFGILIMEFLEGEPLDYKKDLAIAAECLADIHSMGINKLEHLIKPDNFLEAMVEECEQMSNVYLESALGDETIKLKIKTLIALSKKRIEREKTDVGRVCCINTELNSGNFLINGKGKKNYIIDWEKPIIGEYTQDLGHFLAPTTTFWKTDTILNKDEINTFIESYKQAVDNRFSTIGLEERLNIYILLTCLRGITWCSMAWVEYQNPNKIIQNEFTYKKIKAYLKHDFLDSIEEEYFRS